MKISVIEEEACIISFPYFSILFFLLLSELIYTNIYEVIERLNVVANPSAGEISIFPITV